jgi:hypothetical protein
MDGKTTSLELLEPASPEALVPRFGLWPWLLAAAILVIAAVALVIYLKKRRPAAAADIVSMRKAALAEAVAVLSGPAPETTREAAVTSSLVLRKYLAAAAGDPALFETHEEFVSRRDSLQTLTPAARAAAEEGFTRLAALKYAPEIPEAAPAQVIAESRALLETLHHGFAA